MQVGLGLQCSDVSQVVTVRNSSCGKAMFLQVSVCPEGEVYTPRQTLQSWADPPPDWPLQRTVRILLECILVFSYFYLPQRSWGKVMFLHVSVILFTGGVCPHPQRSACWEIRATSGRYAYTGMQSCYYLPTKLQERNVFSLSNEESGGSHVTCDALDLTVLGPPPLRLTESNCST